MHPKHLHKAILILGFLLSLNLNAQNINEFYFQVNEASKLAESEKMDSAILSYEKAFEKVEYVHTNFLNKVLKLSETNKDEKRITNYSNRIKKQEKGTVARLKSIIDSLFAEDQKVRQKKYSKASIYYWECFNDSTCNKETKKYREAELLREEINKTDQSNTNFLLNLFETHGYIGEELIGHNSFKVYIMLLHFGTDTNNTILQPVLNQALKEGKILPIEYATILDRHSYYQTNTQTYWTWPCSSKTKLPIPKSDFQKIEELRKSVGIFGSEFWQEKKGQLWILRNEFGG